MLTFTPTRRIKVGLVFYQTKNVQLVMSNNQKIMPIIVLLLPTTFSRYLFLKTNIPKLAEKVDCSLPINEFVSSLLREASYHLSLRELFEKLNSLIPSKFEIETDDCYSEIYDRNPIWQLFKKLISSEEDAQHFVRRELNMLSPFAKSHWDLLDMVERHDEIVNFVHKLNSLIPSPI